MPGLEVLRAPARVRVHLAHGELVAAAFADAGCGQHDELGPGPGFRRRNAVRRGQNQIRRDDRSGAQKSTLRSASIEGDHARIAEWRRRAALERTRRNRPDLLRDEEGP